MTLPPPATVEFTLHGQQVAFYLPDPTDLIQKKIIERQGFYEPTLLEDIRARVHRGELCVDVGAHLGNHTVFLAKVCGARVLAFEPQPDMFDALRRNVELNGLEELVTTYNVALGERPGHGTLRHALPDNTGSAKLELEDDGSVRVSTLDEHVGDLRVSLMKIDVEGFELEVLKGAERVIARDNPIIYAEAADDQSRESLEAFLSPRGYVPVDQFAGTPVVVFVPHNNDEQQRLAALGYRIARIQKGAADGLRVRLNAVAEDLRTRLSSLGSETKDRLDSLGGQDGRLARWFADLTARSTAAEERLAGVEAQLARIEKGIEGLSRADRDQAALLYELWSLGAQSHALLSRDPAPGGRGAPARYRPLNTSASELATWTPLRRKWTVPTGKEAGDYLQGYTSQLSVHRGERIEFRMSTDRVGLFAKVRIFGFGVKGDLGWSEVHSSPALYVPDTGVWRPGREDPGAADWQAVHRFRIGKDWNPGCYVVRFETVDGMASLHHFWVTSAAPAARTLRLSSMLTHAMRNRWGGYDLARWKPWRRLAPKRHAPAVPLYRPHGGSRGSSLLRHELSIQRWAYTNEVALDTLTDVEVHRAPELLSAYDHVVIVGDASYFTRQVVAALRSFRDAGGSISVFGAAPGKIEVALDLDQGTAKVRHQSREQRASWRAASEDLWRTGQVWSHKGAPLDLCLVPGSPDGDGARPAKPARIPGLCGGRLSSSTLDGDDPGLLARTTVKGPDGAERRCDTILVNTEQGGTLFVAGTDRWFQTFEDYDREHAPPAELDALTTRLFGVTNSARRRYPLVSVVMTAFNSAPYISRAIDSILSQSYSSLELIVVDDNSSDDTFELLLSYAERDRRIRPFKSFQNHGTYWSKNFGMTVARGEFITFQDSDDSSDIDRLAVQLVPLRAAQKTVASVADYVRVNDAGQVILNRGVTQRRAFPSLMIRASVVISRIGFFDCVRTSADQEYFHRLRLAFEPAQIAELRRPLYRALSRDGSLTTSGGGHVKLDGNERVARDRLAHLSENRRRYVVSYEQWHDRIKRGESTPFLPFPLTSRPFDIPAELGIATGRRQVDLKRGAVVTSGEPASRAADEIRAIGSELRQVWLFANGDGPDQVPGVDVAVKTIKAFTAPDESASENAFTFTIQALPGEDGKAAGAHLASHSIVGIERVDEVPRDAAEESRRRRGYRATGASGDEFDVIIMSDFRFPGGTSHSNAQEIKAQARLGFSTGLLQVANPVLVRHHSINPAIEECVDTGLATYIPSGTVPKTKLLLVRHPTVLMRPRAELPSVQAENLAVIVNQQPADPHTGRIWYNLEECQARARECFGMVGTWFPIGPLVRRAIQGAPVLTALAEQDWSNIIDLDEWRLPRTRFVAERPVIGRHTRDRSDKWPADADELRSVYPDDGEFLVRILGGADYAQNVLGTIPPNWEVFQFGSLSAREFLARIDFFVYYHHPDLVEAFGRTILEAMATGAAAILPPHFAELFEDAAIYSEPAGVREIVRELRADLARYQERSRKGIELVERRFSYAAHARRLEMMGCEASGLPARQTAPAAAEPPAAIALVTPAETARAPGELSPGKVIATAELEADCVYKFNMSLEGIPERASGVVRGVSRASGEPLFEVAIEGAKGSISNYVITKSRPEQVDVILSVEGEGGAASFRGEVRFRRRAERPKQPQLEMGDTSITAAMATYPGRRHIVPAVIDTLLPQVDRLFVYLNNYDDVPDFIRQHPQRERIAFILDPASQKRAAAKFCWLDQMRGYHLVCDDDILYPPDYASRMIDAIERWKRRAVVGVHGVVFDTNIEDARSSRRAVFKFPTSMPADTPVHFLGTGTVALHSDILGSLDVSRFQSYPIANDEILAVSARKAGVPMICVARDADWLEPHPDVRFGIFEERAIDSDEHRKATELLASGNPWPALDRHSSPRAAQLIAE